MAIECPQPPTLLACAFSDRVQVVVQYLPVVRYYRRLEAESKAAKPDADVCAAMHAQPALTTFMHHMRTHADMLPI